VRTRPPRTLAWYLPLVYSMVGGAAGLLAIFAFSSLPRGFPAEEVVRVVGWALWMTGVQLAGRLARTKSRWNGAFFIAFGFVMAALGTWVLVAVTGSSDGTLSLYASFISAALLVALGTAALLFPPEPHGEQDEDRKSTWFLGPKKRWSVALVLGLVGAAAGLAAAGSLFPTSIVRACIGVVLAGLAVWGAFRTGKDLTSASLLLLTPSVLGIVITGLRWLPACIVLLFAAISDWPRERERREFRERRG
jgi:hypothetical protein